MIEIADGEVIDVTRRVGIARFINHSCYPNCEIEKWSDRGKECCGVFTVRGITAGEVLTFDYGFELSEHSVRLFKSVVTKVLMVWSNWYRCLRPGTRALLLRLAIVSWHHWRAKTHVRTR